MASFVKKTFLLVVSLVCFIRLDVAAAASSLRQSRAVPHTLVPGIPVSSGTAVPRRCEIRDCIKDSTWLNIYLLGLAAMQAADPNSLLSFYRISGIHGTNFQWDGDNNGGSSTSSGYCHHGDSLFPTWHRPYLSLFEKTLLDLAQGIINGFTPGNVQDAHIAAIKTWRLPYWDWAVNASLADIMGATMASQTVTVTKMYNGALASVSTPNPLYRYVFQIPNDRNTYAGGSPWPIGTVRNPKKENGVLTSQLTTTNTKMTQQKTSLKNSVYNALTYPQGYIAFSNMASGSYSPESSHGTVHVTVGGSNGHMSLVPVAAFDPIFWLHHANIDRLVAIWQAINPTAYLPATTSDGSPNMSTPLYPFRQTENQYWTSQMARDTKAFGYTYPETDNATPQSATAAVNTLYGPNSSSKRKRDVDTTDNSSTEEDPDYLSPTTASTAYNEYHVRIKISNAARYGSFRVNIFLGEPSYDATNFAMDPSFVGSFDVFTVAGLSKPHKKMVRGVVSITTALYERVAAGELENMKRKTVQAYVKNNLKWVITGVTEEQSGGYDLDGLDISVDKAKVKKPKDQYSLPVWGQFSTIYKVV